MFLIEIESLTRVWKPKLRTELSLFVRDIILSAKCYVVSLPFVFLGTHLYLFLTMSF